MTRRLTVSLQRDVYEAVTAQAEMRGCSRTAIINEILVAAVPALNKMTETMERAAKMTEAEREALRENLARMADDVEAASAHIQRTLRLV